VDFELIASCNADSILDIEFISKDTRHYNPLIWQNYCDSPEAMVLTSKGGIKLKLSLPIHFVGRLIKKYKGKIKGELLNWLKHYENNCQSLISCMLSSSIDVEIGQWSLYTIYFFKTFAVFDNFSSPL
jgi:hypothetical protein